MGAVPRQDFGFGLQPIFFCVSIFPATGFIQLVSAQPDFFVKSFRVTQFHSDLP